MSTPQPVKLPPKLPPKLARFADPATRPLHMDTSDVEYLYEYWWPVNGHGLLNKHVKAEVLIPVPNKMFKRKRMFETEAVLRMYGQLTS